MSQARDGGRKAAHGAGENWQWLQDHGYPY